LRKLLYPLERITGLGVVSVAIPKVVLFRTRFYARDRLLSAEKVRDGCPDSKPEFDGILHE
jgi:hypothetical protein